MKRLISLVLAAGLLAMLGGCYYPAYQRPGVVYDGDNSAAYYDDDGYYSSGYYPSYDYYPGYAYYGGPYGYGYGAPWLGLGFYGSYYCCGHHGFHGHDGWHGGGHGTWHGGGHGGGTGGHHGGH